MRARLFGVPKTKIVVMVATSHWIRDSEKHLLLRSQDLRLFSALIFFFEI